MKELMRNMEQSQGYLKQSMKIKQEILKEGK